jgi:hypothetical protein
MELFAAFFGKKIAHAVILLVGRNTQGAAHTIYFTACRAGSSQEKRN